MKKSLLLLVLALVVLYSPTMGQQKKRKSKQRTYVGQTPGVRKGKNEKFLESQWWMGMHVGTTLTEAVPTATYSVLSAVDYNPELNEKVYDQFNNPAITAGLDFVFYYKGFNFGLSPNYRKHVFTYRNNALWSSDEDATQKVEINYEHKVDMEYLDLPLSIQYEFNAKNFRPFITIGGYYSFLMDASKTFDISGTDYSTGGQTPLQAENNTIGASDLFIKSSLGVFGGIGTYYTIGHVRLQLAVNYRKGLHNITNANNRYTNNRLAGLGDAMDDIEMNSININLGILLPLRFLSKDFKSTEN